MSMRFAIGRLIAALGVVVLAACASLLGPRTVEIPEARLQALLAERFPLDRRVFDVIEVHIPAPRLTLRPATNRVALDVDIGQGASTFTLDGRKAERFGSIGVTAGIRFEPNDNTLRLFDVRVEQFAFEGLGSLLGGQGERVGKRLAEGLLENQVLYTLRPKDVAGLDAHGYRPTDIRVTATGLAVTLAPSSR